MTDANVLRRTDLCDPSGWSWRSRSPIAKLLLMDEPTPHAPRERIELMRLTAGSRARNRIAVLFTSMTWTSCSDADRILVLNRGSLIAEARPKRPAQPAVRAIYLGEAWCTTARTGGRGA